jgi:hypothetical protein
VTPTEISKLRAAIEALGQDRGEPLAPEILARLAELKLVKLIRGTYHLTGKGGAVFSKIESGSSVENDFLANDN